MTHEKIWSDLGIQKEFLGRYALTIGNILFSAGKAILEAKGQRQKEEGKGQTEEGKGSKQFVGPSPDQTGINQCLHLATTILLLGTTPDVLKDVVNAIPPETSGDVGPATVVTSVVLFRLLLDTRDRLNKPDYDPIKSGVSPENMLGAIKGILQRFRNINWVMSPAAVTQLQLDWPYPEDET